MSTLLLVLGLTLLGGLGGLLVASSILLIKESARTKLIPWLVSYAVGALLGASMLEILPKALEQLPARDVFSTLLLGILLFFILEKLVLWRHCHEADCDSHTPSDKQRDYASAMLILAGDAIHNALDGVMLAAAFLTDVRLGIVAGIAVIAHEVPQEVGDFAILLNGGLSRARALTLNLLTSLTSVIGGVVGYFALRHAMGLLPYALAVTAASLLYVAVADLIPGLHRRTDPVAGVQQVVLIAIGIAVIVLTDTH